MDMSFKSWGCVLRRLLFPLDGLQAAICAQRSLQAEPWGETAQFGCAWRYILERPKFGRRNSLGGICLLPDPLPGFRLLSAGHGGQVMLSKATRDLLAYDLPAGVEFRDLGEHHLKGLLQPEQIFQLFHPDLPADFPQIKTLDIHVTRLPLQLTSFIGRDQEIKYIKKRLSTARLVTLTGCGGVGKTGWP